MLPVLLLFNSEKGGGSFHIDLICDIFLESGGIINETANRQTDKGPYCQSCGFSSCHIQMQELDYKEG